MRTIVQTRPFAPQTPGFGSDAMAAEAGGGPLHRARAASTGAIARASVAMGRLRMFSPPARRVFPRTETTGGRPYRKWFSSFDPVPGDICTSEAGVSALPGLPDVLGGERPC